MNDKDFQELLNEIKPSPQLSEQELIESAQYYNSLFPGVCPYCGGPISNGEIEFIGWCSVCEEDYIPSRKYYFNIVHGHSYGKQ